MKKMPLKRRPGAMGFTKSCAFVAIFGMLMASVARADQFVVKNLTSKAVMEVHVSHPSRGVWGSDLLDDNLILPNEQWTLYLPGGLPCDQDIMAVMIDGERVQDQVNICNGSWTLFRYY